MAIPNSVGLATDQRQVNGVVLEDPVAAGLPCTARDVLRLKASGKGHVSEVRVSINRHARVSGLLQCSCLQFALVIELSRLAISLLQHFGKTDTVRSVAPTALCEISTVHGVIKATFPLGFGHHTGLVEAVKLLFLRESLFEGLQLAELTHSVLVQLINALERMLSNRLLVVSQKKAAELAPLEKVLTLVLRLGHGQNIDVLVTLILLAIVELKFELICRLLDNTGADAVNFGGAALSMLNLAHLLGELHSVHVLFRGFELLDREFPSCGLLAEAHTAVRLQLESLVVLVTQLLAHGVAVAQLNLQLGVLLLLGVKNALQDVVARVLVVFENPRVHDLIDSLCGQVVQLLPVGAHIQ